MFGRERCVPQFCVGDSVGNMLEERFDRGVEIIPLRHLLLVLLQVELINGGVGGDQVVVELPQGQPGATSNVNANNIKWKIKIHFSM